MLENIACAPHRIKNVSSKRQKKLMATVPAFYYFQSGLKLVSPCPDQLIAYGLGTINCIWVGCN